MTRLKYFWLLASLLLLLLASPFVANVPSGRLVVGLLFSLVLVAAVNVARASRAQLIVALCLAVPWIGLRWASFARAALEVELLLDLLSFALLFFTISVVLARIVRVKESDFDILCGAASIYLLLGVAWAVSFHVIEAFIPGSFALGGEASTLQWTQYLYFSLITLTTLGYGDIAPLGPVASLWAALEAVTGVLYSALLIARLVSLYRS